MIKNILDLLLFFQSTGEFGVSFLQKVAKDAFEMNATEFRSNKL